MKMIHKCVRRMDQLDLGARLSDLRSVFPLAVDVVGGTRALYFPSPEMGSSVRERVEAGFRLLEKLCGYCQWSGDLQLKRMTLGHFWNLALNHMSVISRIW